MAEADRGFLGLTHNPFVQPDAGFFEQADRKAHLEQLRHLSQWSRRVLLVTGPEGVGKSSLYRQLSATLEPRCKAARIHGGLVNASREVLMSVAQGFGIAAPSDANSQLLGELISSHVEEQTAAERVCVVLVDDADHLEPKAIVELMTLASNANLQLVFFAEVRLVAAVERIAGRLGLGWHEMRLTGFSEQQTREYLEWRFQQARYRGRLPFTENQVKEIQRLSEGLPGKINQMANVLLVKLETGEGLKSGGAFPAVHKALLLMLTVVIGLLYLLWQQNERVIDTLAQVEESQTTEAEAVTSPEPETGSASDVEPASDVDPVQETRPVREAARDALQADAGAVSAAPAELEEEDSGADAAPAVLPEDEIATAADEIGPGEPAQLQEPMAPAPEAAPAVAEAEAADQVAEAEPAVAAPAAPEEAKRDGRWLLTQPADAFTLQLVTVSSAERAAAYMAAQPDPSAFASYQLARDGRILHVVVYGVFATRAEAEAAARTLPASVGNVSPWLRPLAQVHGAIGTTPQ